MKKLSRGEVIEKLESMKYIPYTFNSSSTYMPNEKEVWPGFWQEYHKIYNQIIDELILKITFEAK